MHRYDAKGKPLNWHTGMLVFIDGEQALGVASRSNSAVMFGSSTGNAIWNFPWAFATNVKITIARAYVDAWPAVGVQIANVLTPLDSPSFVFSSGRVLPLPQHANRRLPENRPGKPPPAPGTEITVTAPDWDLGELQRGKEATQTFATDAQRLCFAYDAKYIEYDKYLISVSSRNGVADNKFLLVSAADGSETVPYTLSFTGAARRWRAQYQWTAVDVGQERADVPDAHVQDMGWRHDQGRRFQRCAYVHHHNPTLGGARWRSRLVVWRSCWLRCACSRVGPPGLPLTLPTLSTAATATAA